MAKPKTEPAPTPKIYGGGPPTKIPIRTLTFLHSSPFSNGALNLSTKTSVTSVPAEGKAWWQIDWFPAMRHYRIVLHKPGRPSVEGWCHETYPVSAERVEQHYTPTKDGE